MPQQPIHALVVDDSAVVRQMLSEILRRDPRVEVSVAAHPLIALEKMQRQRPDVIVLDLEMPEMDGLSFLERVMAADPIPVVVCSGLAARGTETALRAVDMGAVAVIEKPRLGVKGFLQESAQMFLETVTEAARVRVRPRAAERKPRPAPDASAPPPLPKRASLGATTDKVVALGASTGGTEALRLVLEAMPVDAPGVLVVQHMPEVFTRAFAERLDKSCRIEVREAADGDRVLEGRALIAPGNRHLMLRRSGGHYAVEVADGPLVSRHRPSVDVLFRSVAVAAGPNAVGAILTGMGDDGAAGLLEMKQAGAATLAQDEASCVVFGMPKEAIQRGAAEDVVPLDQMASMLLRKVAGLAARAARTVR
jgi:two-component system, chemotaxis family, protein-glutamate methylesterase/glutaminase